MDQIKNNLSCRLHPDNELEFIRIKHINQNSKKSLFYCSTCINEDLSFKGIEYIQIHQITTQGDSKIIQKWPPIDNQERMDQLIQIVANSQSHSAIEQSIISFFNVLKSDISDRIDGCQKKMINLIDSFSFDGESIIKKYQSISQICKLRDLLVNNSQQDLSEKEQDLKKFIISVEEQKDRNTQQLQDLINLQQKNRSQINFEIPNQIKESILSFIDQINLFESDQIDQPNSSKKNTQTPQFASNLVSDKIMKLISNKSNFCSDSFLNEVKMKLSMLNSILSSISFENQFQPNKQPLQFTELTQAQFDKIDNHVQHLIKLNKGSEYSSQIKKSQEIKSIKNVLSNKINFIERSFLNRFEEYLTETYPYFQNINFENIIADTSKFESISNLSLEMITNFIKLSKIMSRPNDQANASKQTLINKIKHMIHQHYTYIQQSEINTIFNNYPIFDLLVQPEVKDLMSVIQLEKGNYNGGKTNIMINNHNNQIEVNVKETNNSNIISNITLEKDKKYIFKFQIQILDSNQKQFMIGLMKSEDIHNHEGYSNYLSCYFKQDENSNEIQLHGSDFGIFKNLKGNGFSINCNNNEELELQVCLSEQILQVVDFPDYRHKIGVSDSYKQNLLNYKDLKLLIWLYQPSLKVILKSAAIVKQFNS